MTSSATYIQKGLLDLLGFSLSHHRDDITELDVVMPVISTHLFHFHTDVDNYYNDTAYFLFVVRDPLERAK